MKIILDHKESENFFHTALCNVGGDFASCGLELDWSKKDYQAAKKSLEEKIAKNEVPHFVYYPEYKKRDGEKPTICFEDVLLEILVLGGKLKIKSDGYEECNRSITLKDVHERVQKADTRWILEMHNESGDSTTAFEILQMVFFEKSIFG